MIWVDFSFTFCTEIVARASEETSAQPFGRRLQSTPAFFVRRSAATSLAIYPILHTLAGWLSLFQQRRDGHW